MWLIIATISFEATYQTLYSFILYVWGDPDYCNVLQNYNASATSTVFARSFHFVFWYYPVIWLFWPSTSAICRIRQKKQSYSFVEDEEKKQDSESDSKSSYEKDQKHYLIPTKFDLSPTDSSLFFESNLGPQNGQNGLVISSTRRSLSASEYTNKTSCVAF